MKKMLKRLGVVIPSTILTLLMAVGFSTPAFAYVDTTEVAEEPVQVIEEEEPTEEEKSRSPSQATARWRITSWMTPARSSSQ